MTHRTLAALAAAALAATALAQSPTPPTPPASSSPPAPASQPATAAQPEPAKPTGVALIQQQAEALKPLATTPLAQSFLAATADLPRIQPRTLLRDPKTKTVYSQASAGLLTETDRAALTPLKLDEQFYYTTKYGSPLAYIRALDLLGDQGVRDLRGQRLLDFGYGGVGHLRLMASLGADAVGVDVDPLLREFYSDPADQGPVHAAGGADGRITLVDGRWPADETAKAAVGTGFDLILSKNTLKNGYIHPERPVDKRMLVDLGVDDQTFVNSLAAALNPGGRLIIYNLCPAPAPADKPYIPWADGRCPFPKEMWTKAGLEVVAFDVNDDAEARRLGKALAWDQSGMNLEHDLFAWYTIVRKPAK